MKCVIRSEHLSTSPMERNIAVYSSDGDLLQWVDEKRFRRLAEYGRVARVTKTPTGRIKRVTLHHVAGEAKASLLSDYNGTNYCFRQHLDDGTVASVFARWETIATTTSTTLRRKKCGRSSCVSCWTA